jgi:hypothetical protein
MGSYKLFVYALAFCLVIFLFSATSINAAYIYLDPTSGSVTGNTKLEVNIRINTEGEKPTTTDAIVVYDQQPAESNLSLNLFYPIRKDNTYC